MSFASILSGPAEERPSRRQSPQPAVAPAPHAPAPFRAPHRSFNEPDLNSVSLFPKLERKASTENLPRPFEQGPNVDGLPSTSAANQIRAPIQSRPAAPRKTLSQRDIEHIDKIMNDIEHADKSDVEGPGFVAELERYIFKGRKRAANTERAEAHRCKVRCYHCCFLKPHTNEA